MIKSMGESSQPTPVLLIVAAFSRYDDAFVWGKQQCAEQWGTIGLTSDTFAFEWTSYYTDSMGEQLKKLFWAFEVLIDPETLPHIKHQANALEMEYARESNHEVERPLNLDPGYITQSKLILASTKDHAHRIYLSNEIYAEMTLQYRSKQWQKLPWTYPDYQQPEYHEFFSRCRIYLRERMQDTGIRPVGN